MVPDSHWGQVRDAGVFKATWLGCQVTPVRAEGQGASRDTPYLTLLHDRLLPALRAVASHDAGAEVLAVTRTLFHGVGLGVVAVAVGWGAALCQAELPPQGTVLLLHLAHAHLQALALPLAGGRIPGAVWL